jgi:hypothetical protein
MLMKKYLQQFKKILIKKFKKSKSVGIGGLESIKSNSKRLSILAKLAKK